MLGARRGVTEFIEGKRSDRLDIKCLVSCTQTWNCSSRLFQRNIIFKDNVTETLTLIYYFYKRSAKRNNEVQEVAEIMEEHFHKPEKASGTSWVDLKLRPATKLIANWKLIVIHLQNYIEDKSNKAEDWPKGKGILDRKSTRLNSSHANISYAVFCLKKKKQKTKQTNKNTNKKTNKKLIH